jgi:DNA-binding beta-propeller fold protein YncE
MVSAGLRILVAIFATEFASTGTATEPACAYRAGAATIELPGTPFAAESSADGCWLYVSLTRGPAADRGAVAVLHNEGGAFVLRHAAPLDGDPAGLRLTHDGKHLLVSDGAGVSVLDAGRLQLGAQNPVAGRVSVGAGTAYLAISGDDRTAFASQEKEARIAVIDLERLRNPDLGGDVVIGRIPTGRGPVGLALSGKGDRLYAASQRAPDSLGLATRCPAEGKRGGGRMVPEGLLSVIDVGRARSDPRSATLAVWPAGCSPVRVVLSADDRVAWVSARGEDAVYRFDVGSLEGQAAGATRQRFAVGSAPVGLSLSPTGNALWVSNSNRYAPSEPGTVERIDLVDGSRRVLPTGPFPRDLLLLPDGETLVVAVFGSSRLQMLPTGSGSRGSR